MLALRWATGNAQIAKFRRCSQAPFPVQVWGASVTHESWQSLSSAAAVAEDAGNQIGPHPRRKACTPARKLPAFKRRETLEGAPPTGPEPAYCWTGGPAEPKWAADHGALLLLLLEALSKDSANALRSNGGSVASG